MDGVNHAPRAAPAAQDARTIAQTVLRRPVRHVRRFPAGLCHHVYDVVIDNQRRVVVRIARPETQALLAGGVHWSGVLRPRGIPLPALLDADLEATIVPFAWMLLEHLPGRDLGRAYPRMSRRAKRAVAARVAGIQAQVHALPEGAGFGYVTSRHEVPPHGSWAAVIEHTLLRSQRRIAQVGAVDLHHAERVWQRLTRYRPYLAQVLPTAFLDDTTTKNVIIHQGVLTGIVDVDEVCYGDPLWTIGLTQMSLLKQGRDLDYITAWTEHVQITAEQRHVLTFYTAVFCVDFLSELGQVFNRERAEPVDAALIHALTRLLDDLLDAC